MARDKRKPTDLLPLTPGMFHVLIALSDGEKHGYAIIKEVSRRTDGAIRLSAGTLYTLIRRFVQEGVVVGPTSGQNRRWTMSGGAITGSPTSAGRLRTRKRSGWSPRSAWRARRTSFQKRD